ncbi:hypothetical protein [Priestia megaterium]|nr:hypothetical protein [Priestia megaterium]
MIGGQGEDFCRKSASDEKAHWPPAESNRGVRSDSYELIYPICSSLD